jgi:hypothetical protein
LLASVVVNAQGVFVLIDRCLLQYEVTTSHSVDVDAGWRSTYDAIRNADLNDPMLNTLPSLPAMPRPAIERPGELTIDALIREGTEWLFLAEVSGIELVVGTIGPFWPGGRGPRGSSVDEFVRFRDPGHLKFVVSFTVVPRGPYGATLGCEARVGATDDASRKWLRRYWTLARPGAGLVVKRILSLIKREAEERDRIHLGEPAQLSGRLA